MSTYNDWVAAGVMPEGSQGGVHEACGVRFHPGGHRTDCYHHFAKWVRTSPFNYWQPPRPPKFERSRHPITYHRISYVQLGSSEKAGPLQKHATDLARAF